MAQHDYSLANQTGLEFRADVNNALQAIVTDNSGATEPSTTFPGMVWRDTSSSPSVLKKRNDANDAWITVLTPAGEAISGASTALAQRDALGAQATLVSGTNIKTINGVSVLGSGNIEVSVQTATETRTGIVELATAAEAQAFTADKFIDGAKLAAAFQGPNASLAANGKQKLPSGLIIQWGTFNVTAGNDFSTTSVTLPIAFPNSNFCVTVTANGLGDFANVTAKTTTQFTVVVYDRMASQPVGGTAFYIAIGY